MALIVAPVLLYVVLVRVLERHDFPVGDIRSEPWFWALAGFVALVVVGTVVVGSIRAIVKR